MAHTPRDIRIRVKWDRLGTIFSQQRLLQKNAYGYDPSEMEGEQRIQFIKDMNLALQDELHEFLQEVGWKPWATSRHVNEDAAKGELVDALHFFVNLCMVVNMDAQELFDRYMEKRKRNEQRQIEGYDGVAGKCGICKRALDDEGVLCREDPLLAGHFICEMGAK